MKKAVLFAAFILSLTWVFGQDLKVGVRFKPLNSSYMSYELLDHFPSGLSSDDYKTKIDSLTIGVFAENYFENKSFLVRLDVNYARLNISDTYNSVTHNTWQDDSSLSTETYKQDYININLGIGTHVTWNKFIFTFGIYVPLTFLPEGKVTKDASNYSNGQLMNIIKNSGSYKPTVGAGIGAFAGISTVILKHLSIGLDVSYDIQFLSRKLTWHGEKYYYNPSSYMTYGDETFRARNYFTSKIIPSIVIAYAFNAKKK